MGGKRTLRAGFNPRFGLVLVYVPFKHFTGSPLHSEPAHERASADISAAIVPLAMQAKDIKTSWLRFGDNGVTKGYHRNRKTAPFSDARFGPLTRRFLGSHWCRTYRSRPLKQAHSQKRCGC
jgi:hypothetical protein